MFFQSYNVKCTATFFSVHSVDILDNCESCIDKARLKNSLLTGVRFYSGYSNVVRPSQTSVQKSTRYSSSSAIDDDETTFSCTTDVANPWWAVDVEREYLLSHVSIISPDLHGYRNYRPFLLYSLIHQMTKRTSIILVII